MIRKTSTIVVLAMAALRAAAAPAPPAGFEARHIWVRWHRNLHTRQNVDKTVEMMERAAKAGYTGMVLVDNRFHRWRENTPEYLANCRTVREAADRLKLKLIAACLPMGYANDILSNDPNLAAGAPVVAAPFAVKDGRLVPDDPLRLVNPTFSEARGSGPAGWSVDRPGQTCRIDREVTCNGLPSLRMDDPADNPDAAHARAWQALDVQPWRYYHFSVALKTDGLTRPGDLRLMALAMDGRHAGHFLNIPYLYAKPAQDWTRHELTFNTLDCTKVGIYIGTWSGGRGRMWWADVRLEPGGLVNVLRRDGAPVRATSGDGKVVYEEGKDFTPIRDPLLGKSPYRGGYHWHEQPSVAIPPGSRLKEGDKVLLSYAHTMLMCYLDQVPICMSEPKTNELIAWCVANIAQHVRPDGYMMMHDEIRMQGWDESCRGTGKTCGQILADNTRFCVEAIRKADPGKMIYVWSDMYDPTHNARKTGPYELCRGDGPWHGSWLGLPADVGAMNWNRGPDSLKWFASRGHPQIVSDDRPEGIVKVLREAGAPGIVGAMYTTWDNDYSALEAYAAAVRAYAANPAAPPAPAAAPVEAPAPAPQPVAAPPAAPPTGGAILADMDTLRHKPTETKAKDGRSVPVGTAELVDGKFGKACKFTFNAGGPAGFMTAWVVFPPEADASEGLSFHVKGDGSASWGGLELIDGSDYKLRYGVCFPVDSTEWRKIVVPWRDVIPELAGPLVGVKDGYQPSQFRNLWFGKWFYWREYPGYSVTIDQVALEAKLDLDRTDYTPASPGLPKLLAKLRAGKGVTIVTMGDSLTDKRHWANRQQLWAEMLAARLKEKFGGEVKLVNPAIGGTTLSQNLILMPRWLKDTPRPDLVTVWFGYNDYSSGVRGERFAEYLRLAVDRIRRETKGAEILLMTTCPAHSRWQTMDELASAVRTVAAEKKTALADLAAAFHQAPTPEEALKRNYWAWDKTHLGPPGHQLVVDTVLQTIVSGK